MQITVEPSRSGRRPGQLIPALVGWIGTTTVFAVHLGVVTTAVVETVALGTFIVIVRIGTDVQFRGCNRKRGPIDLLRAPATVNHRVGVVRVQPSVLIFEPQRTSDGLIALPVADIAHLGLSPGNTPWLAQVTRLTIASAAGHETRMTVTAPSDAVLNALRSVGAATP